MRVNRDGTIETLFTNKDKKWWEEEAERQGIPVDLYIGKLKMEKENSDMKTQKQWYDLGYVRGYEDSQKKIIESEGE